MIVNLDIRRLKTLDDVRAFLADSSPFEFTPIDRAEAYRWIEATLRQLRYATLVKADKGAVRHYVGKVTGFSRAQVARLISQFLEVGKIRDQRGAGRPPRTEFVRSARAPRRGFFFGARRVSSRQFQERLSTVMAVRVRSRQMRSLVPPGGLALRTHRLSSGVPPPCV